MNCIQGFYQSKPGTPYCLPCVPGHYQNEKGQEKCSQCIQGKFNDRINSITCLDCPAGFSSNNGSSRCQSCEAGKYSNVQGENCKECAGKNQYRPRIDKGEATDSTKCLICPPDKPTPNDLKTDCIKPDWTIASDCNENEYLNEPDNNGYNNSCLKCPHGAACKGDITWSNVTSKFGWSRCLNNNHKFARCSFPGACIGRTNNALIDKYPDLAKCEFNNCSEKCNTGYLPGSRLCSQCASNYSHVGLTGKCDQCPPPGQNLIIGIAGVFAGLLGLVVFIQITLSDGGTLDESDGAKSIGLSFIQLISLLVTFPIAWPPIFVAIFQVGGAITVLGQHLVNLKWYERRSYITVRMQMQN